MKYIRTNNTNFIYKFNDDADYMQYDNIKGHIVKVADTIEELCDEFIIENDYCGQISQSRYFDFEVAKQNIDIASNDVIYGALRIAGKGLIYVAKMNEKGELELL